MMGDRPAHEWVLENTIKDLRQRIADLEAANGDLRKACDDLIRTPSRDEINPQERAFDSAISAIAKATP